jgi:hypothetical protein
MEATSQNVAARRTRLFPDFARPGQVPRKECAEPFVTYYVTMPLKAGLLGRESDRGG